MGKSLWEHFFSVNNGYMIQIMMAAFDVKLTQEGLSFHPGDIVGNHLVSILEHFVENDPVKFFLYGFYSNFLDVSIIRVLGKTSEF